MPVCKECHIPFTIALEDKNILNGFGVPEPQLCYDHVLQQHMAFRNERNLYKRVCEMCKKSIVAMYSPTSYAKVFCRDCWYSDAWDPMSYGRDYDFHRSFFEQFFELLRNIPHISLVVIGNHENSDYTNFADGPKNCYLTFSSLPSENCIYNVNCDYSKDCVDNFSIVKSELLYDCVEVHESYKCVHLTRSKKCSECYFGLNLQDCQNCFGCVNLKHKQYYWFNEPLLEQEYKKRLQRALASRESFVHEKKNYIEHVKKYPVEFAVIRSCENCTGNELHHSVNLRNNFHMIESENCGESMRGLQIKNSYRFTYGEWHENVYQVATAQNFHHVIGAFLCTGLSFCEYVYSCFDDDYLFGCVGLRKKKYCILNKQYTENEYKALRLKIIENMKARGEWGEYFPIQHSMHAYNDSIAQEFFPMTRDQVLQKGWKWNDGDRGLFHKETIQPSEIPGTIEGVEDSILQDVLCCVTCQKNYRIMPMELSVLRTVHLPLPLTCPECRFKERYQRRPKTKVYPGRCMCDRDHDNHKGSRCATSFSTVYKPGSNVKVYCSSCYQQEVS